MLWIFLAGTLALPLACDRGDYDEWHVAEPPETADANDWRLLFNGENFDGWRGFQREDVPEGWAITPEGEIHFTHADGDINTGLITEEQFSSFELAFDWRIAPGGNSGVFFHVTEDEDAIWKTGPEYQIVDNAGHPDGEDPLTAAGSNYALHGPEGGYTRPAGEYNEGRVVVSGNRVEHWLNGQRIVEYESGSEDWENRVAQSGFADHPRYGRTGGGYVALQEGGPVWFRNILIREIPE